MKTVPQKRPYFPKGQNSEKNLKKEGKHVEDLKMDAPPTYLACFRVLENRIYPHFHAHGPPRRYETRGLFRPFFKKGLLGRPRTSRTPFLKEKKDFREAKLKDVLGRLQVLQNVGF